MKKCDDPIKGSGSGPKENVLQYGSAASSPFTVLVMLMRNTDKWDVMNIRMRVNYDYNSTLVNIIFLFFMANKVGGGPRRP